MKRRSEVVTIKEFLSKGYCNFLWKALLAQICILEFFLDPHDQFLYYSHIFFMPHGS